MKEEYKEPYKPLELHLHNEDLIHQVKCPKCNNAALSSDININDKIAKCTSCNVVYEFKIETRTDSPQKRELLEISKPAGVELLEIGQDLEIEMNQPASQVYIVLVSLLPLFVFIFLAMFFKKGISFAIYPGIASLALLVFSTMKLILSKKDKVFLGIDKEDFYVQYRPNNFTKDFSIPKSSIKQIYLKHNPDGVALYAILSNPEGEVHKKLISRISSVIEGKFIEQALENKLELVDKKVIGEIN